MDRQISYLRLRHRITVMFFNHLCNTAAPFKYCRIITFYLIQQRIFYLHIVGQAYQCRLQMGRQAVYHKFLILL